MTVTSKNQVKMLMAREGVKLKDLAFKLTETTGKKYTPDGLSHKLARGRLTYDEMILISDLLGYEVSFTKIKN